ncbi:hypothetical protein [Pseudomonas aeruginosa]|nr:hypothetical protein [Pseudomonas aeruginosa]
MSDDKVVPMKKREDRYEALIRDEAMFDELVLAIIDLDFNCIVFEPEDGA